MKTNETNITNKQKIIAVVGPTASGKTSLAIEIAKKFDGELINTDSRQIYKYLDIGTAKGEVSRLSNDKLQIPNKYQITNPNIKTLNIFEIEGVPIHLINIVKPDEVLTLAQYQKLAYATIEDVLKRGKLPILVGGTGLYIDAIVKGYKIPRVPPNLKLRKQLNSKTVKQLQDRLIELIGNRFNRLNASDKQNPHRLIRLIEIEIAQKGAPRDISKPPNYDVLFLTPKRSREELYDRINKRAKIIIESGLIEEVKSLIKKGYSFSKPAMTAISYPIVKEYLEKKITKKELIERFAQGDRNYARRQCTWFKRYNAKEIVKDKEAFGEVKKFINGLRHTA